MKKILPILFFISIFKINAQYGYKEDFWYKHAIGIDVARPIKLKLAYGYISPEIFYRHYLSRRFFILEGIGFNSYKSDVMNGGYKKIFGLYNRLGLHYVTHKIFDFRTFSKVQKKENGSIGINIIGGYLHHQGNFNYKGSLLTPYSESVNQRMAIGAIEFDWSPIILRAYNLQINLNFRTGTFITSKRIKKEVKYSPITSTGLSDTGGYGSFFGLNVFYKFGLK